MRKTLSILLFLFLVQTSLFAQIDMSGRCYYPEFDTTANNNLLFRLENNNFLKNNEYFGNYAEGYTLIGFSLQPSLMYYAGRRFRIKAGVHLTQFFGESGFTDVLPVISAHLKATKRFEIIMGALSGDVNHNLIEPMFNPEYQYLRPVENGLQFLFNSYRFTMDTWIDWEQFITWGDTIPERFTAGFSSKTNITNKGSNIELSVPVQLLAFHQSGQISDYNDLSYSLVNTRLGVTLSGDVGKGFIQKVWLDASYLGYKELSGPYGIGFESGHAIYPVAGVNYKYGQLMMGYWYADNYFALKGNPIFQSVSNYKENFYNRYRNVGTIKFKFTRTYMKELTFNAGFDAYYDFSASQFDYSYGVSIIYTPNFKIAEFSSR